MELMKKTLMLLFVFLCVNLGAVNTYFPDKQPGKAEYKIGKDKVSLFNDVLRMDFSLKNHVLFAESIYNMLDSTRMELSGVALFAAQLSDGRYYSNMDFKVVGDLQVERLLPADSLPTPALRYPGIKVCINLENKLIDLTANWVIELRDGSNYIRQELTLSPQINRVAVSKVFIWDGTLPGAYCAGTVLGSPIMCGNYFFGMEHPIAHTPSMETRLAGDLGKLKLDVTNLIKGKGNYGISIEHGGGSDDFNLYAIQLYCGEKFVTEDKHPLNGEGGSNQYLLSIDNYNPDSSYSLVFTYRNREKATGLVHLYHKKKDILSFYVQRKDTLFPSSLISESGVIGVAGTGQMRRDFQYYIDRERARPYKPFLHYNCWWDITDDGASSFTSDQLIERMHAWYEKLIKPYGIHLNSFVFDDGWDDMKHHVWGFDPEKFPEGFSEQAALCKQYNSGIGVWMSPFGGYLAAQQQRIKTAKKEGLEVNGRGLSLAGKHYYNRFLERSLDMLENYKVNYFKYDGFGGSEPAYLPDMEAGIKLVKRLRQSNPDVYINITVGSWPSPFWLRHVDCTWRGSGDLHQAGEGERTQKFMTYRDGTLYNNVVCRGPYYPLNSIMTAGIAYANLGHPNRFISDDLKGFKDMVRSSFAAGSSLQELYISHDKMKPEFWPVLAEAIKWSVHRTFILKDTHWVGGSPINLEVYGFASWNGKEGVLSLRNPSSKIKGMRVDLQEIMEMPAEENGTYILKSPWKEDLGKEALTVNSSIPVILTLNPFECLVFDVVKLKNE